MTQPANPQPHRNARATANPNTVDGDFLRRMAPGQLFEELFGAIPDTHFFVKNRQSRFVAASHGFAETLGAPSLTALIGKTDHDFTPSYLADAFRRDDLRVLRTGRALRNRVELVPNNQAIPDWRTTTKIPVRDTRNRVIGVAGITRALSSGGGAGAVLADLAPALECIRHEYAAPLTVPQLARRNHVSVSTLERRFRTRLGTTPLRYLRKVRVNAASNALRATDRPIAQIAHDCGFCDQSSLTRQFRQLMHISPAAYRRRFATSPAHP